MHNENYQIEEASILPGQIFGQSRETTGFLKAISHESRLMILCLLVEGEKAVNELEDLIGMPQAAVSQHLARLREDRLVKTRRDGRVIYYSPANENVSGVVKELCAVFCKVPMGSLCSAECGQ